MFKNFLSNIKEFFSNLFHGRVELTSSKDAYDEMRGSKKAFEVNSNLNSGNLITDSNGNATSVGDLYAGYNATGQSAFQSVINKYGEVGLTGQQIALNEMQMDNQRRQYAFNVQGMQEAGLNPALMYESGATSAPSAPAPTQGASMSDLIQLFLAKKQARLLESEAQNRDADTDKKRAETENMNLINKYYPEVTDTQIKRVMSEIGLNDEQIRKINSEIDINDLQKDLLGIDKVIKQAEANESSAYFKAVRELQQANTEKARQEKSQLVVRTAMDTIEKEYMQKTNTKMGSATVVAIAAALGSLISGFKLDLEGVENPFDVEGFKKSFKEDFDKLIDWINKPKKAPWVKE